MIENSSVTDHRHTRHIKRIVLAVSSIGFFVVILASTAVNVALKAIEIELAASVSSLQWVVNGFLLTLAGMLLGGGSLSDRFGSKNNLVAGFLIFGIGSALAGFAYNIDFLIFSQFLAGIGAALLVASSLTLLSQIFTNSAERSKAISIWAATGGAALVAGPLAGGLLTDVITWRAVFFADAIVGIATALATIFFTPKNTVSKLSGTLDIKGQVLAFFVLSSLTFALIQGGAQGWSAKYVLGSFFFFIITTTAFLWTEYRNPDPMLPLKLFQSSTFAASSTVGFLLNFAYYGQIFMLSIYFQQVWDYSPLWTGLALTPMTVTVIAANLWVGKWSARVGNRLPMVFGFILCGVGLVLLALIEKQTAYWIISLLLSIVGFGGGLIVPPMTAALLSTTESNQLGIGSGVLNTARQVGGVIGVALFGAFLNQQSSVVSGARLSFIVAGIALFLGSIISFMFVESQSPG